MFFLKLIMLISSWAHGTASNGQLTNSQDCIAELIEAAEKNDLQKAINILKNGCDVNGKIEVGSNIWTCALRNAVYHPDAKMVELLLNYGSDPNLNLGKNLTPFHYSAGASSLSIFKLLYKHKGDINTRNETTEFETPLIWAIAEGKIENVQFLIDCGVILNPDSIHGLVSPLATAVSHRQYEITQLLIDSGADVNSVFSEISEDCITCPSGITIMHRIVDMNSYENKEVASRFFDLLLKYKPNLNIESEMGYTPLEHACFRHDVALVDKLIANGAVLKTANFSALHCAAMFSNYKMVKHLLAKGADSNVKDENGNTPLMIAYDCCGDGFGSGIKIEDRIKTTEILLNNNADPTIKNHKGESFLDMCKNGERQELKDLLIERGILTNSDGLKR